MTNHQQPTGSWRDAFGETDGKASYASDAVDASGNCPTVDSKCKHECGEKEECVLKKDYEESGGSTELGPPCKGLGGDKIEVAENNPQDPLTSYEYPSSNVEDPKHYHPLGDAESLYDKDYFNGGGKVGGYTGTGFQDFPSHWCVFDAIKKREPKSFIEIGGARGYIVKRVRDYLNVPALCVDVSRHCELTRVVEDHLRADILDDGFADHARYHAEDRWDLLFSCSMLEHIPEDKVFEVLTRMIEVANRGLLAIDFGEEDDGFDKTHCNPQT